MLPCARLLFVCVGFFFLSKLFYGTKMLIGVIPDYWVNNGFIASEVTSLETVLRPWIWDPKGKDSKFRPVPTPAV